MGVKSSLVPGKHNENTKLLGFFAHDDLIDLVDAAKGSAARSQFLREAVVEYMEARGVKVPEELKNAPDRTGKGGPTKYRISKQKGPVILDRPNSKHNAALSKALRSVSQPKNTRDNKPKEGSSV